MDLGHHSPIYSVIYLASNGRGWKQRKLTVNNGQASGFREKIMLKRGLLDTSPYAFNRQYFLVNDHNDVRVIKRFLVYLYLGAVLLFISLCISYLA